MGLTPEQIESFRQAYREAYGKDISAADAEEMASRLLALYRLLARPLPNEQKPPEAIEEPPQSTP